MTNPRTRYPTQDTARRDMITALLSSLPGAAGLYRNNATFRARVDLAADLLMTSLEPWAEQSTVESASREAALRAYDIEQETP